MNDLGEFLERLGRRLERLDRPGRFGWNLADDEDEPVETIERELVFGEAPALRLNAGMISVSVRPVAPGERARLVLRGRRANEEQVEIGSGEDGAITVDVHPRHSWQTVDFRPWRVRENGLQLEVFVPQGIRLQARVEAGRMSVADLHDSEFDLRTDAGKLRVSDCNGRMRIASSAGKVELERIAGTLDARTDAGAVHATDVRLTGDSSLRASAGSLRVYGLRLLSGNHVVETSLGSVRLGLAPDAPVRIETHVSLGSVDNRAGPGPEDAPAHLKVSSELGSVRIRLEEAPATPLHHVSVTDARIASESRADSHAASSAETGVGGPSAGPENTAGAAPAGTATASRPAPGPSQEETMRILDMVERHEITPGEAAALLSALRGGGQ
ncbi:MAG TPA: DUF4097 family beta strand repeat-containing protein [Dehalococcoidia bacterium]|nr:DUF4097 family beta strand repeat-containing protein [Dehalococcoidia bacterium]